MNDAILNTVVSVGQYPPRWMYVQAVDDFNVRGRLWVVEKWKGRVSHWGRWPLAYSIETVNLCTPAEPKPEPPR